jgi:DNA repair exonuclease SbcCD ATPase subunit
MEEMIQRSQNDINIIESELNDKKQLINYKKIQKHSLSDDGIKSNIIREFVPFINSQIQSIVANFDIGLSLYFDAEFKAHIFRMGKEVSIKTISTGQKKILDFAILITMTKILKLKYPDINLIFYDEIFSSIHPNNRIVILDIIDKEIRLGLKMNVVVVSHTHLPESYFQKFIEIYKENNFSKIKITTAA